jgi:SsrA-binding protein
MANNKKKNAKSGLISTNQTVALNKRARFDYFLKDTLEAGIMLAGTEVKSLRHGQCSLNESYVAVEGSDLYLINANIPEYGAAGAHLQHNPKRKRKLLLHRREINKFIGGVQRNGLTIVPTKIYFDKRGLAKLEIALAEGKKQYDKRETSKERDWNRQKGRLMREKG